MNKNDFVYMMEDLRLNVRPSSSAIERLKHLDSKSVKTHIGKSVLKMHIIVALLVILMVPTAVFAAHNISQIVFEKTNDADITEELRNQIQIELEEDGYTVEEIKELYPLRRNEDGLTYGLELYHPDLIMVEATNGKIGYIYRTDEENLDGENIKNPSEALEYMERKEDKEPQTVKVYKEDGETIIGEFEFY